MKVGQRIRAVIVFANTALEGETKQQGDGKNGNEEKKRPSAALIEIVQPSNGNAEIR